MQNLLKHAKDAASLAYAPYSQYKVGCAISAGGKIYTGCNIENASYGATICAERAAVASAVADGCLSLSAIAIFANGQVVPYPCGICLQVLAEFASPKTKIIVANDTQEEQTTLQSLLPKAFSLKPNK